MKKYFLSIIYLFAVLCGEPLYAADGDLFAYPVPPTELTRLDERCDYLVEHFWDHCDFKSAMSRKDKLDNCFGDWISFMPYATSNCVLSSIDRLLESVKKSGDQTLLMAQMAEKYLHSDSADYISDEIYLPFAQAAANCKKISSAQRVRYEGQVRILNSSSKNKIVPDLQFTTAEGEKLSLREAVKSSNVVIFFNDPDCFDCNMAKVRLSADFNLTKLLEDNTVQLISIYPGDADEAWRKAAAEYPEQWTVVACPDADLYFDLSDTPKFYCLDRSCRVTLKDVPLDSLLNAFQTLTTGNYAK
jgi:hypothetical protein